jgi:hypothetical protein
VTFPILDGDGDPVPGAAGLDSEISIDGAAFVDCQSEAVEIASASGMYYLDLTAGEMNGDTIAILIKSTTPGAKTTPLVIYPEDTGDIRVNATAVDSAPTGQIADAVWDEPRAGHTASQTFGEGVAAVVAPVAVATNADKTGYKLAADGLDVISTAPPMAVAGTFREMVIQVWRRFFKKCKLSATDLKTYRDDGTTVATTQSVTDQGGEQTLENAT